MINWKNSGLGLILIVGLLSCGPIKLISDYDQITDQKTVVLHEAVAKHFVSLEHAIEGDSAQYKNYIAFYDQVKVDLEVLSVRAKAIEKNRVVIKQVEELKKMTKSLEELHKIGFSSYEQIEPLKQPFNSAFTAIVKLQMALKRGEK